MRENKADAIPKNIVAVIDAIKIAYFHALFFVVELLFLKTASSPFMAKT